MRWFWQPKPGEAVVEVSEPAESWEERYAKRTAEVAAELAALQAPVDIYRIQKDFQTGRFSVLKWSKYIYQGIRNSWANASPYSDYRAVVSGHESICANLPSHSAARGWLRAYIDPTTNRTGYDADGKPVEIEG